MESNPRLNVPSIEGGIHPQASNRALILPVLPSNSIDTSLSLFIRSSFGPTQEIDHELKLPPISSLTVIILSNLLLQISFFIIVSSSSAYAQYLGGSATFSGLVIGIPTVFSGLALIALLKIDQGKYQRPLHVACACMVLGNILYALAYKAKFLYLILFGRIVQGFGFTQWMYSKRYCSDPRLVGIRKRTTLAGWLVLGQGCGMSLGPFLGGLLYKIGFSNTVFNGFTSPSWIMAIIWMVFWVVVTILFKDVPVQSTRSIELRHAEQPIEQPSDQVETQMTHISEQLSIHNPSLSSYESKSLSWRQWGVIICMCWYAMTCFFILGAWESNIPVFGASSVSSLHWSPFTAGNFIALGGVAALPFLLLNLFLAQRIQDRHILALGSGLGLIGLLIAMTIIATRAVNFGRFLAAWFFIALGFNLASTCTLSLLSKQLPGSWNGRTSLAIQYSNYTGRVTGAVLGGSGVEFGMLHYIGLQLTIIGLGVLLFVIFWRELKAKTG